MKNPVPREVRHQRGAHRHRSLGATLPHHVQPPVTPPLIEVGGLCMRRFRDPQPCVVQQADQPAAALVVLVIARGEPRLQVRELASPWQQND